MAVELVHVGADLEPLVLRQARRVDPRTGDDDHPQLRHVLFACGNASITRRSRCTADPGAADGDDADRSFGL